jgi:hypothetical protein
MNEEIYGPALAYDRVDRNLRQTILLSFLLVIVVLLQLACLFIFLTVTLGVLVIVNEFSLIMCWVQPLVRYFRKKKI